MASTRSGRIVGKRNENNITLMPVGRKSAKKVAASNALAENKDVSMQKRGKRKAELSPLKNEKIKRSALGNLTNNVKPNGNVNTNANANANITETTLIANSIIENDSINRKGKKAMTLHPQGNANKQTQAKAKRTTTAAATESNNANNNNNNNNNSSTLNKTLVAPAKAKVNNPEVTITKRVTRSSVSKQNSTVITTTTNNNNDNNNNNNDNNDNKDNSSNNNSTINRESDEELIENELLAFTAATLRNKEQAKCMAPQQAPVVPHKHQQQQQRLSNKQVRRISNEFNKTEESLYMSALEDVSVESLRLSGTFEQMRLLNKRMNLNDNKTTAKDIQQDDNEVIASKDSNDSKNTTDSKDTEDTDVQSVSPTPPDGVDDFDKENINDPYQVAIYAMDIFNYMKQRETEECFTIADYMPCQVHLTKWMRSLLIDWMVEVQETFELNHETLYLAVKIVDIYLGKQIINKEILQLLGAAALFIACKYDERTPPLIEDFLFICDGAYKQKQLLDMEMSALRTIGYDLSVPLSYRFLRRYARCARIKMPTLTLARYILELALMDYDTIRFRDSKLAAAALFMALRLHGEATPWNQTLEYYSGYTLNDFAFIVPVLNCGLHCKPKGAIKTIRSKYAHKIFYEVAKVTLMTVDELFHNNLNLNDYNHLQAQNNDSSTKQSQPKTSVKSTQQSQWASENKQMN